MSRSKKIRVLFVCLGNICRSPTAEGVFREKCKQLNLLEQLDIESAGTSGWHIGEAPDPRAMAAAKSRGYDLSRLRGRGVQDEDFAEFDYILAMDSDNLNNLFSRNEDIAPEFRRAKIQRFLEFANHTDINDVPDPYYGGDNGFEHVLDLIESASDGFIKTIQTQLEPSRSPS